MGTPTPTISFLGGGGGEGGRVQVLVVAAQTPQNLSLVLKTALF